MKKLKEYKFKTEPFKHQYDAWMRSRNAKYWALLMEMGTGKTKVTLDTAAYMFDQGWINNLLIIGNKGSYLNWIEEIDIHLPDHISREIGIWKATSKAKETRQRDKVLGLRDELIMKVLLVNIESIGFERCMKLCTRFLNNARTLMVIDESSTIKNPTAKRTKAAWKLGSLATARRILTGSPVDNSPLNIWAQYQFLANGLLGYTSYYSFRSEFAELQNMRDRSGRDFKIVVGYKNIERLQKAVAKYAFVIKSEDCLDLPKKIYPEPYQVELTKEQKHHYTLLKEKAFTILDEKSTVTTKIVLTQLQKFQQLLCGHIIDDDGVVHSIDSNRLNALISVLEETQGKVIIWTNYRYAIKELEAVIKAKYGAERVLTYYGDTTQKERDRVKKELKRGRKSKVRFLIGNPQTGGYGLNLTAVNTVIYYSNNYDAEQRNQSEKRAHRIGQTKPVTYIDFVTPDTVDAKIIQALRNKKKLSEVITPSNWRNLL